MFRTKDWRKSTRTSDNTNLVPFSKEIRDFISESRQNQTLFANLEGSCPRRVLSKNDKNALKEFVYCTLYYDLNEDQEQNKHINNIANKIISFSKKYMKDEVHFGAIWIFCYSEEETIPIPLFKVYKAAYNNEAAYIDENLKVYDTWDYYIENAEFPSGFLCVPRNGEYRVLNNMINVEYISKSKISNKLKPRIFKSFSFSVFSSWVGEYNIIWIRFREFILRAWSLIKGTVKLRRELGATIVCFLRLLTHIYKGGFDESNIRKITSDISILGKQIIKSSSVKDFFDNFPITSDIVGFRNVSEANETLKIFENVEEAVQSFKSLMKNPSLENFNNFAVPLIDLYLGKIQPMWKCCFPNHYFLPILRCFLVLLKVYQQFKLHSNSDEINHRKETLVARSAPGTAGDERVLDDTIMSSAIEKFVLNLDKLKEAPFENVFDKFYQESANEALKQSPGKQTLLDCTPYLSPSDDAFMDYFMFYNSFPQLFQNLKELVGDEIKLKIIDPTHYKVLNRRGTVVGFIICIEENCIICFLSCQKNYPLL